MFSKPSKLVKLGFALITTKQPGQLVTDESALMLTSELLFVIKMFSGSSNTVSESMPSKLFRLEFEYTKKRRTDANMSKPDRSIKGLLLFTSNSPPINS